jgi:phosphotransacetylase
MEENNVVNDVVGEGAQSNESSQQESTIVFPDEKSFMQRVQRESKKQVNEFVKSLGFENDSQLKELIQKQKEQEESQKTEYQKLQESLQQKEQYINQMNQNLKQNEIKMQMLNAGVKSEKINYALKLIDANDIDYSDGKLDVDKLNKSLEDVLKEFPELKGGSQIKSGGQDFSKSTPPDLLTMEMIKNMSPSEMEKRMDEVLKFLSKK